MEYHTQAVDEVASHLGTSPKGLSADEVRSRLEEFGKNALEAAKKKTIAGMLLRQFTDFMILVLVAAAVVSGFIGEVTDTMVILAIVVSNAIVGVIQEYRAEKAMEALQSMAASNARVVRNGHTTEIAADELVPGDVVMLEGGDVIPADLRLIEAHTLKVDESALTGESVNVEKSTDPLPLGDYPLGDRINMGFRGTSVSSGRGLGYVVETGMRTEFGRIATMIQVEERETPLQNRLNSFGKILTAIIIVLCTIFFLVGWYRGEEWSMMLLTAISLAVAAIPEALPALVTVALALGAKRLVGNNALVRRLPAVETLGSVTYICSDKTGTLTLNKMTVQEVYESRADSLPEGVLEVDDRLGYAMALNHDVTRNENGELEGESTEVALASYAHERGIDRRTVAAKFPRIAELPFDSQRKRMTTFHRTDNGVIAIVKGAVEVLVEKLTPAQQPAIAEFTQKADDMANRGYRTLGYAVRHFPDMPSLADASEVESSLTFLGFAGMMDPVRPEARQAVAQALRAGIRPVMITGDHKLTAMAVARSLGIISSEKDLAYAGPELRSMKESEFDSAVSDIRVYARVDPEQKLRIVSALQAKGQCVAMTGDGVNDAPALKNADIGIAMGINGTDVTKEASDMILLDDNFATIIKAVRHGRTIFDNILKFIRYIMTGNSGEIWTLFLAPLLGLPIPLMAVHILWINLVTDGLPGLALASEKEESDTMERPPRNPEENVFAGGMAWHILWVGLLMAAVTLAMQWYSIQHSGSHWQTMAFTVLCFSQLGHVLAIRSNRESLFTIGVFSNVQMVFAIAVTFALQCAVIYVPFFNTIFKTQPLTLQEFVIVLAASSIPFWAVEGEKIFKRSQQRLL